VARKAPNLMIAVRSLGYQPGREDARAWEGASV
jgi:hypothetical protein